MKKKIFLCLSFFSAMVIFLSNFTHGFKNFDGIFPFVPRAEGNIVSQEEAYGNRKKIYKMPDILKEEQTLWEEPKKVVIDPGHGGIDPGATVNGILEKEIALDISLRVNAILNQWGISSHLTREDDRTCNLMDRIGMANKMNAALFVSVHSNWFKDASKRGTMTLYYPSSDLYAGNLSEKEFALTVQKSLISMTGTRDLGIVPRADLAVLKYANMPSVLVELGFLSNEEDRSLLCSEDFQEKAAMALAESISIALIKIPLEE